MCLILFAQGAHPEFPLVIAANRDENYGRATSPANFWDDHPQVLGGRDLEAMGTWLGVTRDGRFAALTNIREPLQRNSQAPSRGRLVGDFLTSPGEAIDYLNSVAGPAARYNGFNLLAGSADSIGYLSSRAPAVTRLPAGIHGLSNHMLNTPWPKVVSGRKRLAAVLGGRVGIEPLLQMLDDRGIAPDDDLPDTGVGLERERLLSAALIASPGYGTRASTAVLFHRSGVVDFCERTVLPGGAHGNTVSYRFTVRAGIFS